MPNKHNEDRRHHITKKSMKVTNWAEYNAGLRRRGSLTLWVTDEAIAAWQAPARLTRGCQSHYSDTAIETNLLIRAAFRMPLLDQIPADIEVDQVTADGAYDGEATCKPILDRQGDIAVVIPPRAGALPSQADGSIVQQRLPGLELHGHAGVNGAAHAGHGGAPLRVVGQCRVAHGGALAGVGAAGG